jgi:molecular chaperone GrpE (heat shock protein)
MENNRYAGAIGMEILINEQKLDFTLEKEENVGEVIQGLEKYVEENGNIIVSIYVDDAEVSPDCDTEPFSRDLNSVKEIKVRTSSTLECAFTTLLTIGDYITAILNERLGADLIKNYDSIMEGMKLVREGLLDVLRSLNVKAMSVMHEEAPFADTLLTLSAFVEEYDRKYIDAEGASRLSTTLKNIIAFIPKIFGWAVVKNIHIFVVDEQKIFTYLRPVVADLHRLCTLSSDKFEKIGTNLQLGEDKNAMQDLFTITELLEDIIAVVTFVKNTSPAGVENILKEEGGVEEVFHELGVHLKEVESAFRDGDMISVGDILEYEARPLFDRLVGAVEKIYKIV